MLTMGRGIDHVGRWLRSVVESIPLWAFNNRVVLGGFGFSRSKADIISHLQQQLDAPLTPPGTDFVSIKLFDSKTYQRRYVWG